MTEAGQLELGEIIKKRDNPRSRMTSSLNILSTRRTFLFGEFPADKNSITKLFRAYRINCAMSQSYGSVGASRRILEQQNKCVKGQFPFVFRIKCDTEQSVNSACALSTKEQHVSNAKPISRMFVQMLKSQFKMK